MRIRNYRPSDLSTLHKIDQACFPPGISYSKAEIAGFIAAKGARAWVAGIDDEIAGFLIAVCESKEIVHIVTLDVVAAWRRKGVGRALMDAAEAWSVERGARILYLETAEDNYAAQSFYQTRCYVVVEKIDGYYGDGTSAWVMAKRLNADC